MAGNIRVLPLKIERHNEIQSWTRFKNRVEIAFINADIEGKVTVEGAAQRALEVGRRKAAAMLGAIGEEGMVIFDGFNVNMGELQYADLVNRFNGYFEGRENKTISRHRFLKAVQEEGEGLEDFMTRVHQLSLQCQFGNLREELEIHMIIKGMREEKLQTTLLQMAEVTMAILRTTCTQFTTAERTLREMGTGGRRVEVAATSDGCRGGREREGEERESEEEVAAVSRRAWGSPRRKEGVQCRTCRKWGHMSRECSELECFKCLQKGHMAADCRREIRCRRCRREGHVEERCWESQRGGMRGGRGGESTYQRGRSYSSTNQERYWGSPRGERRERGGEGGQTYFSTNQERNWGSPRRERRERGGEGGQTYSKSSQERGRPL